MLGLRLESTKGANRIIARASGYGESKQVAIIVPTGGGYIVDDSCGSAVYCWKFEEVATEIEQLATYSSRCWNCRQPVLLSTTTRCPRCRRFVLCTCGKCLCDKYPIRPALTPEEVAELAGELNRRFGHLFKKKDVV